MNTSLFRYYLEQYVLAPTDLDAQLALEALSLHFPYLCGL